MLVIIIIIIIIIIQHDWNADQSINDYGLGDDIIQLLRRSTMTDGVENDRIKQATVLTHILQGSSVLKFIRMKQWRK
jgi:hypothetical protein